MVEDIDLQIEVQILQQKNEKFVFIHFFVYKYINTTELTTRRVLIFSCSS